mgnify:CR=1 FL=1|jgi:methylated-DNA-[protein]-cysteine S-methyltransferase
MVKRAVTAFEQRVFDATRLVPKGKVTTYKALADFIHCRCAQAVGQALKRNPFAPEVPCHRVVNRALQLHGFQGKQNQTVLTEKKRLLQEEGVAFEIDGRISRAHLFLFL